MKLNNRGQALVEYVLIIALISVACIGVINIFGEKIKKNVRHLLLESIIIINFAVV